MLKKVKDREKLLCFLNIEEEKTKSCHQNEFSLVLFEIVL